MQTLQELCDEIVERSRGGWYGLATCHAPVLPEDKANRTDDWYVIKMPDSYWILSAADVPDDYYSYRDLIDKVLVIVKRKTPDEYFAEELELRNK